MTMLDPLDPLDRPATPVRLRAAVEAAGLSAVARREVYARATASPPPADWTRFLAQALLMLGAGLLLAGIICFFAFNWQDLGRFAKLALLQLAVALCALVGWWRLRDVAGRVALSAAAVLVGPLLGVFGQTYQTGADPWGLFAAWALLILPWVIVSRVTALWVLTIALADLAVTLFWQQVLEIEGDRWLYMFLVLAALHVVAVAAWEWQRRRPQPWLDETWAPRLVVAAAFGCLLAPSAALIFDLSSRRGGARAAGFAALWAAVAAVFLFYRRVREDLFMLTVAGGSVLIVITMALGRLLFKDLDAELGGMLIMAVFIIVEVWLAVTWLRRSVREMAE